MAERRGSRRALTLPETRETALVSESKEIARAASQGANPEPGLVNWTMRLLEAINDWRNRSRRG